MSTLCASTTQKTQPWLRANKATGDLNNFLGNHSDSMVVSNNRLRIGSLLANSAVDVGVRHDLNDISVLRRNYAAIVIGRQSDTLHQAVGTPKT